MSGMKVHHLNYGTMRPRFTPDGLVCHVLLIETPRGLALVDTGIGTSYARAPGKTFGSVRHYVRPLYDDAETALAQVKALGFDPHDIRDIVVTHFDADHIGGVADFPWARIHLTSDEADAALSPKTLVEKERYLPANHEPLPTLVRHNPAAGDPWRGFAAATELTEINEGIVLLALPGHSRGHAAVAVDAGTHWVLHVGDSFYHHGQLDGGKAPLALTAMERVIAYDWPKVRENHARLAELWRAADPDLLLVNAHDPQLLTTAQNRNTP
ncbi:hypothetical protein GOHSU_04_01450 [Gordonia hirsuta DSM 44140 = NBRC 16056]|uniref:Metallo-beta-lactamase domain-containing protein n=2 Tax=Gordonia hirsuta TaxID=53427 RepID=L7L689_9ACTN|nr:hypothetical protein GOHSU_04_01450 [Gordonia hirsuta DSM 44140 = NBRC 16056]